jgi:hypothetical protein
VEVRHELELAVVVTDIWHRVDALVGEYLCDVWQALLTLREVEPSWRCPSLERDLSPDAPLVVVTAHAAARGRAEDDWGRGDLEIRRQIAAIRSALHRMTLGHPVLDPLSGVTGAPPRPFWSSAEGSTDEIRRPTDGGASVLRLIR